MGITISRSLLLSTCVLFISLMQLINGQQFLNITLLFLSDAIVAAPTPCPTTVIASPPNMYALL